MFPDPLRTFQRVVQTGSIRKASEQLSLAPSSVSRQIAILERQIGTELFRRSQNGIVLTHAGELVAEYADSVVGGFDSLRSDLDDLRGSSRLITVAMVESVTSIGPGAAVERFRRRFENVTFVFDILPAPAVVEAVRNQQCDLGITFTGQGDPSIDTVARVGEPVVIMVPLGSKLSALDRIVVGDLVDLPLALPPRTFGVRQIFDRVGLANGLSLRPTLQTNSFEALRDFVRSGAGGALLPRRAALRDLNECKAHVLRFDHPELDLTTLDLIMLKQHRTPRLTRLFVDILREELEVGL